MREIGKDSSRLWLTWGDAMEAWWVVGILSCEKEGWRGRGRAWGSIDVGQSQIFAKEVEVGGV